MTTSPSALAAAHEAVELAKKATPGGEQSLTCGYREDTQDDFTIVEWRGEREKYSIATFERPGDAFFYRHAYEHYAAIATALIAAEDEKAAIRRCLEHAVYRKHDHFPNGCEGCAAIDKALSTPQERSE